MHLPKRTIIAHRGVHNRGTKENSLAAFRILTAVFRVLFLNIARYAFGKGQKGLLDITPKYF